jgi:tRNA(fMet)-specific endonuclease VapC
MSELLKGKNATVAARSRDYLRQHQRLTLASLSVTEVIAGYRQAQRTAQLENFRRAIEATEVLPFGVAEAEVAGLICGDLARNGQSIGAIDPLIAAVAICNDLVLVTGNQRHFQRIQSLGFDLRLDNWRDPRP